MGQNRLVFVSDEVFKK